MGWSCPASAPSPGRWSGSPSSASTRRSPSAPAPATPVLGICLGFQLLFDSSTELGGAQGLGLVAGAVEGLDAAGVKVPHMGWEPVRWERESELSAGIESETPFYFVHGFAPRPADAADVLATAVHGDPLRLRDRAPAALRGPVSPREVERRRPAAAAQLRRHLRGGPRVILLSGDRRARRARRAARAGRLRARDRLRRRPARRRRALGRSGCRGSARRRPRRGPRGRPGQHRARGADLRGGLGSGPGRRRAAPGRRRRRRARGGGGPRGPRHRGALRSRPDRGARGGARRPDRRLGRRPRRAGSRSRAGSASRRSAPWI